MTDQQIYDKVKKHLLAQNKKASRRNGKCAYRGKDGLKCAIGCLIPDELYSKEIEGQSVETYESAFTPNKHYLLENILASLELTDYELLIALQCIHDNLVPEVWEMGLKNVAKDFKLKP